MLIFQSCMRILQCIEVIAVPQTYQVLNSHTTKAQQLGFLNKLGTKRSHNTAAAANRPHVQNSQTQVAEATAYTASLLQHDVSASHLQVFSSSSRRRHSSSSCGLLLPALLCLLNSLRNKHRTHIHPIQRQRVPGTYIELRTELHTQLRVHGSLADAESALL